jgi:homoserine dehydrogenase
MADVRTRYYMRLSALDKPGVLAKISGVLAKRRISIALVSQKIEKREKVVPVIMMTHSALERDMAAALKEIDSLGVIKKKTVCVRVEE